MSEHSGIENLPNLYIKKIVVDQASTIKKEGLYLTVTLLAKDYANSAGQFWSDDEFLMKHMQAVLVTSNAKAFGGLVSGDLSFDPLNLRKSVLPEEFVDIKACSVYKSKNRKYSQESPRIFEFKKKIYVPNKINSLSIYCAFFVNIQTLVQKNNGYIPEGLRSYSGPITSERVLPISYERDSYIFKTSSKSTHPGPIHTHSERFMQGSFHTNQPHNAVRPVRVMNYKIIDNRAVSYKTKSFAPIDKKVPILSELFITAGESGIVKGMFKFNWDQFQDQYTKYGKYGKDFRAMIYDLGGQQFYSPAYFNIKVFREIIQTSSARTSLGTSKKVKRKLLQKKLLFSRESLASSQSFKVLVKNSDNLFPEYRYFSSKPNDDNLKDCSYYKFEMDYALSQQTGKDIFNIHFSDYEVKLNTNQEVRYSVEISHLDSYPSMVSRVAQRIQRHIESVARYYKKITENIDPQRTLQTSVKESLMYLFLFKRYLVESPTLLDLEIRKVISSMIYYDSKYLNNFIFDIRKMFYSFKKTYNIKKYISEITDIDSSQKIFSKKNDYNFKIKHAFQNTLSFGEIQEGYQFHDDEIMNRTAATFPQYNNAEYEKFVSSGHSSNYSGISEVETTYGDLSYSVAASQKQRSFSSVVNTSSIRYAAGRSITMLPPHMPTRSFIPTKLDQRKYRFLSPRKIKYKEKSINLFKEKGRLVDHREINEFMANRRSMSGKINKYVHLSQTNKNNLFLKNLYFIKNIELKDMDYVSSSIYLGEYSPFVNIDTSRSKIDKHVFSLNTPFTKTAKPQAINLVNFLRKKKIKKSRAKFDPRKKNNITTTKRFKTGSIPPQINTILRSTSRGSKNKILSTPVDKITLPELSHKIDLQHFVMQKVFILGHFASATNGQVLLNAPKWVEIDMDSLNELEGPVLAKLQYYIDPSLGVEIEDEMKLNVFDKYFYINSSTRIRPIRLYNNLLRDENRTSYNNIYNSVMQIDFIEYTTNQPVVQNSHRYSIMKPYLTDSASQAMTNTGTTPSAPRSSSPPSTRSYQASMTEDEAHNRLSVSPTRGGTSSGY